MDQEVNLNNCIVVFNDSARSWNRNTKRDGPAFRRFWQIRNKRQRTTRTQLQFSQPEIHSTIGLSTFNEDLDGSLDI